MRVKSDNAKKIVQDYFPEDTEIGGRFKFRSNFLKKKVEDNEIAA